MGSIRLIVAIAGLSLVVVAALLIVDSTDSRRWLGFGLSVLAGLMCAVAVGAWRRSWQRGRRHRERWGSFAWLAFWVGVAAVAFAVFPVGALVTTVVSALMGATMTGIAISPAPRPPIVAPRFAKGWNLIPIRDGRAGIDEGSLDVPTGWTAWRVPGDAGSGDGLLLLSPDRRWDLPMPSIGAGRLSAADRTEAGTPEEMAERLLAEIPADMPIAIENVRRGSAHVGGETAMMFDFEARLLADRLPVPTMVASIGLWLAGVGPVTGRVHVIDRADERWIIGWIGWSAHGHALGLVAEPAIRSWRWSSTA